MATSARGNGGGGGWIRPACWGGAAGLILLPLVAGLFTEEVSWGPADFVAATVLVGGVGLGLELAFRAESGRAWRAGAALALLGGFLLVWINLAVGIAGDEGNPANLAFFGVLAVALAGSALARFRPAGMARAMAATALAQALAALPALAAGLGFAGPATLFFCAFWLGAAVLFRKAAADAARRA